jgi:hypothetical protein
MLPLLPPPRTYRLWSKSDSPPLLRWKIDYSEFAKLWRTF